MQKTIKSNELSTKMKRQLAEKSLILAKDLTCNYGLSDTSRKIGISTSTLKKLIETESASSSTWRKMILWYKTVFFID